MFVSYTMENREAEEVDHYYPFGGILASSTPSVQLYKYNGKELDRKGGLDWYDYGSGCVDPVLGRWHVADPMSEKNYSITPYGYCLNNPVKHLILMASKSSPFHPLFLYHSIIL